MKINPNGKQLVVYRVTTLLFPGKQPIACLKRETTLSNISWNFQIFIKFQILKSIKKIKFKVQNFQKISIFQKFRKISKISVFIKFINFNIWITILKNDKTIIAYHFGQYYCLLQKEGRLPKIEIDWLIKVLRNGCFHNGPVICQG